MAKKKPETRPFYNVMHEYQASLNEYTEAAMMLHVAVVTALHLVEDGADPKRALETLREHDKRFEKAAHGVGVV
jgi:hypothetical protein